MDIQLLQTAQHGWTGARHFGYVGHNKRRRSIIPVPIHHALLLPPVTTPQLNLGHVSSMSQWGSVSLWLIPHVS